MPDLVDLADLNTLRFQTKPRNIKTLQRLARCGDLPGARMLGGRWVVDLEKFDQGPAPSPIPQFPSIEDTRARVRVLLHEAQIARGSGPANGRKKKPGG